jgi:hypothetical protein
VSLARYADEYAHSLCLDQVQRNVTLGQYELFDMTSTDD